MSKKSRLKKDRRANTSFYDSCEDTYTFKVGQYVKYDEEVLEVLDIYRHANGSENYKLQPTIFIKDRYFAIGKPVHVPLHKLTHSDYVPPTAPLTSDTQGVQLPPEALAMLEKAQAENE